MDSQNFHEFSSLPGVAAPQQRPETFDATNPPNSPSDSGISVSKLLVDDPLEQSSTPMPDGSRISNQESAFAGINPSVPNPAVNGSAEYDAADLEAEVFDSQGNLYPEIIPACEELGNINLVNPSLSYCNSFNQQQYPNQGNTVFPSGHHQGANHCFALNHQLGNSSFDPSSIRNDFDHGTASPYQQSVPEPMVFASPGGGSANFQGPSHDQNMQYLTEQQVAAIMENMGLEIHLSHQGFKESGYLGTPNFLPDQPIQFELLPGNSHNPLGEAANPSLKELLAEYAESLETNQAEEFTELAKTRAGREVNIQGDPMERLGAYMFEGLNSRNLKSGTHIYSNLKCDKEPESDDLAKSMLTLYHMCPYIKFGYVAANGAIAKACGNADRIHIVDFQIAQGTQWVLLLQALAAVRPDRLPQVRITGIDDPDSRHARGGVGLEAIRAGLGACCEKLGIQFEFNEVPVFAADVTEEMLRISPGEVLAVNFTLQLHHIHDESVVDSRNQRDSLLRMVKSFNPNVVTLVEQELDTNTTDFLHGFSATLDYYLAIFESIDAIMTDRSNERRVHLEQHCLGKDIINIIAREEQERTERHELFSMWKARFTKAGFRQCPLSPPVNSAIKDLLKIYSEHYFLRNKYGALYLGWKTTPLIVASAWK
ncbi:OLC1v1013488C1 [Oldenlandia corymbosa var. corymbosa]|uniref:OLC1v1013488C1 n=1 Tax=Oldenlandia corymbosa var. corymbosa TaxID=529605 RepID=A0AAV1DYH2_OLDCO|nr:OLC1v1013488C1 [Oldenlandia corymbosa var. corymbosa]